MTLARKVVGKLTRIILYPKQALTGGFSYCTRRTGDLVMAADIRRYDAFQYGPARDKRTGPIPLATARVMVGIFAKRQAR